MDFIRQARRALTRFFARNEVSAGTLNHASDPAAIRDGINYGLPVLMPRQLQDALAQQGKLGQYLQEAAAETFRFQFDTPGRGSADDYLFRPPTEDPLKEWHWSTREYVLTNTHAAYQRNPLANRACKYVAAFVVGQGFNLACKNPDVERVLMDFIEDEDNDIRCYERQAVIDLLVDGEIMLRLYRGESESAGQLVAVPQKPWECHWIATEKGFFRRRKSYHFQRHLTEGDSPTGGQITEIEDVPAKDILHVTINNHGYELRGRPELYHILPWLRAYKEWLENRARQNHWRGSLLWHVMVKTNTAATIAAVAARWRKPPTPGSVAVTSQNEEVKPLSNPIGASDAGEDGRQIKLMVAVGAGLPEYMLSDGANANLASTTSQQMPALMTFADFQRTMIEELWYPLFRLVIQEAIDAGDLPDEVDECDADGDPIYDDDDMEDDDEAEVDDDMMPRERPARRCKTLDAFSVSYTPLQDTNFQALATGLEIVARNGWVDDETATTKLGFDYMQVQKRLKAQKQAEMDAMMRGEMPMPPGMMPPGMDANGVPEDEADEAGEQSANRQADDEQSSGEDRRNRPEGTPIPTGR